MIFLWALGNIQDSFSLSTTFLSSISFPMELIFISFFKEFFQAKANIFLNDSYFYFNLLFFHSNSNLKVYKKEISSEGYQPCVESFLEAFLETLMFGNQEQELDARCHFFFSDHFLESQVWLLDFLAYKLMDVHSGFFAILFRSSGFCFLLPQELIGFLSLRN